MNICVLINSLDGGGAERVVQLLSTHWNEQGHKVVIVTLNKPNVAYEFPREVKIVQLKSFGQRFRILKYISLPFQAYLWSRYLNENKPDHVLSFLFRANFVNILAAKFKRNSAVIISERSMSNVGYFRSRFLISLMNKLMRMTYDRADHVIAISSGVKDKLVKCGIDPQKITVIHNPVFHSGSGLSQHPKSICNIYSPTLVTMGRLIDVKRHEMIIKALSLINKKINVHLIIIGDGPNALVLKDLAKELGQESAITFTGWLNEPGTVLSKADIYIHAAQYEAFGNAIIEAMSYGLPVICTQSQGGVRDILGDNEHGLFSKSDTPEGLAELINLVIEDCDLYKKLSQASFERSKDFSLPIISQRYMDLLKEVH